MVSPQSRGRIWFQLPPQVQRVQSPLPTVLTTPPKIKTTILMADPMLLPATTTISAATTPATMNSMAASTPEFGAIPAISLGNPLTPVVPLVAITKVRGCQTGSRAEDRKDSQVQTSPSKELKEVMAGTCTSQNATTSESILLHSHVKRTIYYPDGRREEIEETKWYLPAKGVGSRHFACCSSVVGRVSMGLYKEM